MSSKVLESGKIVSSHSTMELFLCIWQPGFSTGHIMDVVVVFVSPGPSWSELTLDDQTPGGLNS